MSKEVNYGGRTMAKKSIEDVMNEIEDFLNSCKTTALSSNKVVVPRDTFDELFGDLRVQIPAEIDRCKKIMRNKEAILMDARKTADGIIAQATEQANRMITETEIMAAANQKAYETVEMAKAEANAMLAQASAESNEIRLGSMQYTNDIMMGIRNYMEATIEAERANYENLIETLYNDYRIANANLDEIQSQIIEFTGDVNSVARAPKMKSMESEKKPLPKTKTSMVDKVKQAVGMKEEKAEPKKEEKPVVNIPDFIATGEKVVPNETPLKETVSFESYDENRDEATQTSVPNVENKTAMPQETDAQNDPAKLKKKIVKKRNPVMNTPHTAHETVAKTLEAAAASRVEKTIYKANGEEARAVSPSDGRVKRGPRVGRGMVEGYSQADDIVELDTSSVDNITASGTSMGVVDDFTMEKKF